MESVLKHTAFRQNSSQRLYHTREHALPGSASLHTAPVCFLHIYRKSSHSFLAEQAFLTARDTADTIASFIFLACCGHIVTQRIQEIHFLLSADFRSAGLIAFTGHWPAHRPQPVQFLDAFGISTAHPAFLYGRLPGICTVPDAWAESSFSLILPANASSCDKSAASGLPAAYWCIMECCATAEMAAAI